MNREGIDEASLYGLSHPWTYLHEKLIEHNTEKMGGQEIREGQSLGLGGKS